VRRLTAMSADARLVGGPRKAGRVGPVFRCALNLFTDDGSVITVAWPEIGNGPHVVLLDRAIPLHGLGLEGAPFLVERGALRIGLTGKPLAAEEAECVVELGHAALWIRPVAPRPGRGWHLRLARARDLVAAEGAPEASHLLAGAEEAFAREIARGSVGDIRRGVAVLCGFGPGLTPAGDDYLAGFAGTGAWLAGASRGARYRIPWVPSLRSAIHEAAGETNRVSAHILREFSEGFISETLMAFLKAILTETGPDEPSLRTATRRLLAVGATSGTELARGALDALALIAQEKGEESEAAN